MSALGIDYARLEEAKRRLTRAGDLVDTIIAAGRELDALVDDPDDPVAYALETAASMNGNGAASPAAPAELNAGAGVPPSSQPAPASSATLAPSPAAGSSRDGSTKSAPPAAPKRAKQGQAVDAVLDYFEAHPREWFSIGELERALGLARSSAGRALRTLAATETIESNGGATTSRRYRLDPGLADELERDEHGDGLVNKPDLTDDDVERLERDQARDLDRSATGELRRTGRLELRARIKAHLFEEASTISELALALDVPRREVAPIVLELVEHDDDVVRVEGAVRGRGESIYSNIA